MTHDYKRNGTTTLFAALNVLEGKVIGACMARHRHQEWLKFLEQIDASTPPDVDLHLIVDNYATHKHPKVQLNLVERWFRNLTQQRIRRGVFKSVEQLETAILSYIASHNETTGGYRRRPWT